MGTLARKKRRRLHRGKLRSKFRLPRKLKKKKAKERSISFERYKKRLIKLHGDQWMEYWLFGG